MELTPDWQVVIMHIVLGISSRREQIENALLAASVLDIHMNIYADPTVQCLSFFANKTANYP